MRSIVSGAVVVCAFAVLGCRGHATFMGDAPRVASVNHVVLFTLRDASQADAMLADGDGTLVRIPGVQAYSSGTHIDVGRANIESSYDAGFYLGFDNVEAYRTYLEHPLHTELVARWKDAIESAVIYDFGVE